MQLEKIKKTAAIILLLFLIYIYFCNAHTVMEGVKEGLLLCYNTVIPSLYVFMVISNIISCTDLCEYIAVPFMPYFRLLHINDRKTASCCILGITGGFATGAVMLDKIHNEYGYDKNILGLLAVIMSGNSPSFVILAVGAYYLGNINIGIIIYFSVLISSLISAFLLSFIYKPSDNNICKNKLVYANKVVLSIKSSTNAIITVCGVVTLIFTICKVISLYTENFIILGIFSALLEVTTACEYAVLYFGKNIYLLSLILAICPLSTYLQMKSIGDNNTLNFKILFISRTIQIPIMFLLLRTLLNLFPQAVNVYSSQDINVYMCWNNPRISLYFLLLSVCFVIATEKKFKVFTIPPK